MEFTFSLLAMESTSESGIDDDKPENSSLISTDSIEKHVYHDDSDSDHSGYFRFTIYICFQSATQDVQYYALGRDESFTHSICPFVPLSNRRHDAIDDETTTTTFQV